MKGINSRKSVFLNARDIEKIDTVNKVKDNNMDLLIQDGDLTKEEQRKVELLLKYSELFMKNKTPPPNHPRKVFRKLGISRKKDIMEMLETDDDHLFAEGESMQLEESKLGNTVENLIRKSLKKSIKKKKKEKEEERVIARSDTKAGKYIYFQNDPKITKWNIYIMIAACFNCFSIPFKVAYKPPEMDEIGFTIANGIIDFTFLMDMILSFRIVYVDETGKIVKDPKLISKNYLKS